MNITKLVKESEQAHEELLRLLITCVRTDKDLIGAGQFVLRDGTSEHIGIYGTAAILETVSICRPDWLSGRLEGFVAVLGRLAEENPSSHDARDQSLTFKLCAAINALRAIPPAHAHAGGDALREELVSRLMSFAVIDEVNNSLFWPYAKEETESSKPTYLLPTAYAVHTLAQLGSYRDHLPGAVKYLVHQLNSHLNGHHKLHMHELVHLLLALASVQETERNKHISKSDIRKAEYFLYQYVLQHNYFDATYINFTVSKPKFESLFYVIKTNLTILKYFLQFESIYIRTSDIHRQIWNLVHLVRTDGKFIDAANNRSAVRENALALRAIHLFVEKYGGTRRLGVKWYYSVFFRFLQVAARSEDQGDFSTVVAAHGHLDRPDSESIQYR